MKRSHWVLLLLVSLIVGGSGYYVLAITWPARYAQRVLAFDRGVHQGPRPDEALASRLDRDDPAATRELLQIQEAFVERVVASARALRPAPPQYWRLQRDLERGSDLLRLGHENVMRSLDFQDRARTLYDLIRTSLTAPQEPLTVGTFLAQIEAELPNITATGDALFAGEPVSLRSPSYAKTPHARLPRLQVSLKPDQRPRRTALSTGSPRYSKTSQSAL